jgi:hypothetical protein
MNFAALNRSRGPKSAHFLPVGKSARTDVRDYEERSWLPDMDLNHDKQIQSLLCYRYTIGQASAGKVENLAPESRPHP